MIMMNDIKSSKCRRLKHFFPIFKWVGAHFTFLVTWQKLTATIWDILFANSANQNRVHKWYRHVQDGIPIFYNFLKLTLNPDNFVFVNQKNKEKINLIFEVLQT